MMQIVFWGSAAALLYTYFLYPLLMWVLARKKQYTHDQYAQDDPALPVISVLMAAYNEERVIGEKLYSLTQQDYPAEKLRIYVGSDGSTDRTNDLVAHAFDRHFPLLHAHFSVFRKRRGKPPVINDLAARAQADFERLYTGQSSPEHLFVLTDASVILEPQTLYRLARHFKDERIGLVDTHILPKGLRTKGISRSEYQYLSAEARLKHWESLAWRQMMGPFGGCYALRARLFEPIPPRSLVDDFWLAFRALERGYWAINDLDAICYEAATHRMTDEYQRKKRIAAGNFQNLFRFWRWIAPPATRLGFSFFSHKVLRWFGGFFLAFMFLSAAYLAFFDAFYRVLFGIMAGGAVLSFAWYLLHERLSLPSSRLLQNIAYFLAMNAALLAGFFRWLRGIRDNTWQRTNRE
ncbi:MAG: glycosyltransferase [Saprospiraceae bacterium]|nr:glycosyltransferase [Saprospiraceae bacterium]MDW8484363.1 glycosyltransferase family 2 protein [Saprospiraceae bacterium]